MTVSMKRELRIGDFAGIEPFSSRFARMGDSYILSRIVASDKERITADHLPADIVLDSPMRLNGLLIIMARSGSLTMNINTDTQTVNVDEMFIVNPGTLISFTNVKFPAEFTMLFISTTFMHSINIDLSVFDFKKILKHRRPIIKLNHREADVMRHYFDLFELSARDSAETVYAKEAARALMASLVYELFRFTFDHLGIDETENEADHSMRHMSYIHGFMRLLHLNFAKERNMSFYAERLCISPKYLSMITKEATGRTATEWINDFVITEAKNQLRFSGKSIQQVAYALNFPSQSSFGKFFKRVTGQSPSEYQKN